jgi:hypothetical protein
MKNQRVKCIMTTRGDFTAGKIYELTESGLKDNNGYIWDVFVSSSSGDTLFDKWMDYWQRRSQMEEVDFILVEEPVLDLVIKTMAYDIIANSGLSAYVDIQNKDVNFSTDILEQSELEDAINILIKAKELLGG